MGLNNLETKIRENRTFFDEEASVNHLEKMAAKLSRMEKPKTNNKGFLFASKTTFALAASVTILLLVAIFALLEFPSMETQPQLSEELLHVKMYYSTQTDEKIIEIRDCAMKTNNKEMLFESAEDRLSKLDNNTEKLEQKLGQAQGNKQLENAYILSLKAKSEVVNQIYTQLCVNNTNISITQ